MSKRIAILTCLATSSFALVNANGTEPISFADLQSVSGLDTTDPDSLAHAMEVIVQPDLEGFHILPAAAPVMYDERARSDEVWMNVDRSPVAYALTEAISLGLDYEVEEMEDLTEDFIEMGTTGVDYTSHKVVVRARWQFDATN